MEENKMNQGQAPETEKNEKIALDDARRVKVMSPSMLVLKRFLRNKLAITGLVILVAMFLFSFGGSLISPYEEGQVFKTEEEIKKDYAGAIYNTELRYTVKEGEELKNSVRSAFILAKNKGQAVFEAGDEKYSWSSYGEDFFTIGKVEDVATAISLAKMFDIKEIVSGVLTSEFRMNFETAAQSESDSFTADGIVYQIVKNGKAYTISRAQDIALASMYSFDAYGSDNADLVQSFDFRLAAEKALHAEGTEFEYNGATYTVVEDDGVAVINDANGAHFAGMSKIIVNPAASDGTLDVAFKDAARAAIGDDLDRFTYDGTEYYINVVNANYYITTMTVTLLNDVYASPSKEHLLGLDGNGMDVLTRLMYGGRISLMVGFVVILIELFIGVIFGGVAGFFGGWIDNALMRFIDLFNSIPFWPMCLIVGSVMDTLEVKPSFRIFILMVLLGVLGWTGIARVVRGQILTLREQDFMIATEATGISVPRRIFKHLVPNVMPLLIVQATMGLGSIILTEATLSFLGLGVKYPMASWGNIINAASDIYVMRNYWFIWIPAGILILLSVLGFNFVGDGLRDAFDPKMKR